MGVATKSGGKVRKGKIKVFEVGAESGITSQPISGVQWVERSKLKANDYNPNHVAPVEMQLLKRSILLCGWTQPIVIREDYQIVDGFHRWTIAADKQVARLTDGKVPVVVMKVGKEKANQVAATITHNRARGTHYILQMSAIVRQLREEMGKSDEWIQEFLGMEAEEIERMTDLANSTQTKSKKEFNKGWNPEFQADSIE